LPLGEGEILDVGSTCLTDPEPVEPEEYSQSGMIPVESLSGEEKRAGLPTVQSPLLGRMDLGPADVPGGVGIHPSVDVGEPVEAAGQYSGGGDTPGPQRPPDDPGGLRLGTRGGGQVGGRTAGEPVR
jgi:hypothetical protein